MSEKTNLEKTDKKVQNLAFSFAMWASGGTFSSIISLISATNGSPGLAVFTGITTTACAFASVRCYSDLKQAHNADLVDRMKEAGIGQTPDTGSPSPSGM